jgi:hypothetical protein
MRFGQYCDNQVVLDILKLVATRFHIVDFKYLICSEYRVNTSLLNIHR